MLNKYRKYLPSKKFIIITSIIFVLVIIIFVIFFMPSNKESFLTGNNTENILLKVKENESVEDLIQKDSDEDSIPDWEEDLWGTDKNKKITFDDTPDATYIENKKKSLKIEQSTATDEKNLTETDKFARQFFASYSAMKSSDKINKNDINNFSNALGEGIANPNLVDSYMEKDVKINTNNDTATRQKYYLELKKLFEKYKSFGIGNELEIISNKIYTNSANDTETSSELIKIGNAYQNFAKKVMETSVPQNLKQYHLKIANDSNNTGISVLNMEKVINDPIVGLLGISQYQKYNKDLITSVGELEANLLK